MMTGLRYPGSKAKLLDAIVKNFPTNMRLPLWADRAGWEYREPFFGSGAIGLDVLAALPSSVSAWINDKDYWLVCLWTSIHDAPKELCRLIDDFTPDASHFYDWKEQDGATDIDPVHAGFRKLAIHQMSFSGFGSMAGGPLGGKDQDNAEYDVSCRWNPEARQEHVWKIHRIFKMRKTRITCRDFTALLNAPGASFVYCDPPYVEKGPELYKHSFTDADHVRLSKCLRGCGKPWVLSYDDHELIRTLYAGFKIIQVDVKYTVAVESEKRRKNKEILILSAA